MVRDVCCDKKYIIRPIHFPKDAENVVGHPTEFVIENNLCGKWRK